jgi:hypothetical protein
MHMAVSCLNRPRETSFPGGPNELFASAHVEERVSLHAVLRRCQVAMRAAGADISDITSEGAFCCMYVYDHVKARLELRNARDASVT